MTHSAGTVFIISLDINSKGVSYLEMEEHCTLILSHYVNVKWTGSDFLLSVSTPSVTPLKGRNNHKSGELVFRH